MSFGLSSLKPKATAIEEFDIKDEGYGVPNPLVAGLGATKLNIGYSHPLEASEKNYHKTQEQMNMALLRNTQGMPAVMRFAMELKAADNVGRLPFLPSSNVMKDVLLGRDEDIGFEDILNTSEFREQMGQPHAMIEKKLRIL